MAKSKVTHCRLASAAGRTEMICDRCRAVEVLALPILLADFPKALKKFQKAHAFCRQKGAA